MQQSSRTKHFWRCLRLYDEGVHTMNDLFLNNIQHMFDGVFMVGSYLVDGLLDFHSLESYENTSRVCVCHNESCFLCDNHVEILCLPDLTSASDFPAKIRRPISLLLFQKSCVLFYRRYSWQGVLFCEEESFVLWGLFLLLSSTSFRLLSAFHCLADLSFLSVLCVRVCFFEGLCIVLVALALRGIWLFSIGYLSKMSMSVRNILPCWYGGKINE